MHSCMRASMHSSLYWRAQRALDFFTKGHGPVWSASSWQVAWRGGISWNFSFPIRRGLAVQSAGPGGSGRTAADLIAQVRAGNTSSTSPLGVWHGHHSTIISRLISKSYFRKTATSFLNNAVKSTVQL